MRYCFIFSGICRNFLPGWLKDGLKDERAATAGEGMDILGGSVLCRAACSLVTCVAELLKGGVPIPLTVRCAVLLSQNKGQSGGGTLNSLIS